MRVQNFPFTHCQFGVAVRDVTPPVGIYTRSWGVAKHDTADGVHRPHLAAAALFQPIAVDEPLLALVALDIGWFQNLQANPDARIQVQAEEVPVRAAAAEGEERSRLWSMMTAVWPAYDDYQARTERQIPVVVLSRR